MTGMEEEIESRLRLFLFGVSRDLATRALRLFFSSILPEAKLHQIYTAIETRNQNIVQLEKFMDCILQMMRGEARLEVVSLTHLFMP